MRGLLRLDLKFAFLVLVFGEFLVGVGKESREANMELDLAASFSSCARRRIRGGPDGSALRSLHFHERSLTFQENHEGGKDENVRRRAAFK